MPKLAGSNRRSNSYRGRKTKIGNSLGIRFDKALFQSHPEFSGDVQAHVIAPGRLLVVAEPSAEPDRGDDPVLEAFLSFLAHDIAKHPEHIQPLDADLIRRAQDLVKGIKVDETEDLGDEDLLS
jgi:antitoxin PrlF